MTKIFKLLFSRTAITLLLVLLQLFVFISVATYLKEYSAYIHIFFYILSAIMIVAIITNKSESIQMKLPWLILIAFFPVLGILCYYLFSENNMRRKLIYEYVFNIY